MGYRYFLYEPWHWPVFLSHTLDVPFAKSIAFSDAIPVWALQNKAIATLLPPWESFSEHAYLGMWHATVYILQACFGVALLRALGHTSWRAALLTAVMFLAVHAWIFRYGHAALSAHWLELWALTLYLRPPARSPSPGLRASRRGGSARRTRPRSSERSLPGLQAADAQLRTAVPRRRRATSRSDSTGGATSSSRTFSQT